MAYAKYHSSGVTTRRLKVKPFFEKAALYPNISISGLMTMAPEVEDPEETRPCFRRLRELRDEIQNYQLSTTNYELNCGGNSVVECDLAKVDVVGSNPIRRSIFKKLIG